MQDSGRGFKMTLMIYLVYIKITFNKKSHDFAGDMGEGNLISSTQLQQ